MNPIQKTILTTTLATLLIGCSNTAQKAAKTNKTNVKQDTTIIDSHTTANSLDYQGIYRGTLPDSSQITMHLKQDNKFQLNIKTTLHQGTYQIERNTITLNPAAGLFFYVQVREGSIQLLNKEKQPMEGFVLQKQ